MALGRGVVYGVLAVVFGGGTVLLAGARGGVVDVQQNAPTIVELRGTGSDTTGAIDVEERRRYLVGWSAPCPVSVVMIPWNDDTAGEPVALGTGRTHAVRRILDAGGYFFDVTGACDWVVRVNPT